MTEQILPQVSAVFADRHIGPRPDEVARMVQALGYADVDALVDAAVPASIRTDRAAAAARAGLRGRRADRAAPAGRAQQRGDLDDRPGVLRHLHPVGDRPPAGREPGLVHRLHAVPAGDLPGPARGAAELPDRRLGPDRPADRERVAAGRGHRGRRGDDAGAPVEPQEQEQPLPGRRRHASRRRSRSSRPAPRRSASRSSSPTPPTGCPRATSSVSSSSTRARAASSATSSR